MRRESTNRGVAVVLAIGTLVTIGGCDVVVDAAGPFLGSFLGTVVSSQLIQTTTVERFCFENGEPVDCSSLPSP